MMTIMIMTASADTSIKRRRRIKIRAGKRHGIKNRRMKRRSGRRKTNSTRRKWGRTNHPIILVRLHHRLHPLHLPPLRLHHPQLYPLPLLRIPALLTLNHFASLPYSPPYLRRNHLPFHPILRPILALTLALTLSLSRLINPTPTIPTIIIHSQLAVQTGAMGRVYHDMGSDQASASIIMRPSVSVGRRKEEERRITRLSHRCCNLKGITDTHQYTLVRRLCICPSSDY